MIDYVPENWDRIKWWLWNRNVGFADTFDN